MVDKKFIINIKGKDFVTFEGLLDKAHSEGLESVDTELLQFPIDDGTAIVKATVVLKGKSYSGIGDANKDNVGSMIAPHIIRMAETRAVSRALRLAVNIGMCSSVELGGESKKQVSSEIVKKAEVVAEEFVEGKSKDEPILTCTKCGKDISEKVADYSAREFGEVLCYNCQKVKKESKAEENTAEEALVEEPMYEG